MKSTASILIKAMLSKLAKNPEWIAPVLIEWLLSTIKNPQSKQAQAMKPYLVSLADAIKEKYGEEE